MVERPSSSFLWAMRAMYAALCLLLIFLHLLPFDTLPRIWAGPDLMVAVTFAFVLRRPEYTPMLLIVAVFLMADLLFHRPPGLWTALVLIASQALRARAPDLRDLTFPMEWASVATTLVAITIINRIILSVLWVDQAALGLTLTEMLTTLLVYPLVVLVTQTVLRVRKMTPVEMNAMRAS